MEVFSRNKVIGVEVNADKSKYMVMSQDQYAGRSHNIQGVPGGMCRTSGGCSLC